MLWTTAMCSSNGESSLPRSLKFHDLQIGHYHKQVICFPPAMETFHSAPDSLLPSFSASHMLTASLELRQLLRLHCWGCLIGFLSNSQALPIFTWFFFFLSFLAISAWFYMLSHSDVSEETLFFHWQCFDFCQLSSVLTSGDPAALGQFRGGAANLPFPTVL